MVPASPTQFTDVEIVERVPDLGFSCKQIGDPPNCYPVTDGSRCRDPEPSIGPSSENSVKEREKRLYEQEGVKIMMRETTKTADLSTWEGTDSGQTTRELASNS